MLEKLQIKNFQKHQRLTVEFSPTITTIIGASDSGKSSLYRALYWLVYNKPLGGEYVHWDKDTAALCLDIDGQRIVRAKYLKNTGDSYYRINKQNKLKAFGTGVPEDVLKVLNLDSINFQNQHDSPFWFSETAGEVSRQLNAIVDLSSIDLSLSKVASLLRESTAELKTTDKRIKEAEEQVEQLSFVTAMSETWEVIEKQLEQNNLKKNEHTALSIIVQKGVDTQKETRYWKQISTIGKSMVIKQKTLINLKKKATPLSQLVTKGISLRKILSKPMPNADNIIELKEKWQDTSNKREMLKTALDSFVLMKGKVDLWQSKKVEANEQIKNQFKGICPLCGNKMKS